MKKMLLALALVMTTGLWAYDFQVGDLYYDIVDDNRFTVEVVRVSNFLGSTYEDLYSANIPDTINMYGVTYTVVGIEGGAFRNCRNLKSITLPNTIQYIGQNAFLYSGVYENNQYWTNGVMYLNKVLVAVKPFVAGNLVVKNGTTAIADGAFEGCSKLTSITLPESVTSIRDKAFWECSSLTSVTIGNGVTSIGERAFLGCSSLTSITIPESVTSIGYAAFEGCSSLETIHYTGTKKQWESITKNTYWKGGSSIKTIVCSDKKVKAK